MALQFGAILTLKDNFTSTMKKAVKSQNDFKDSVDKTKKTMDNAFAKEISVKVESSKAIAKVNDVVVKHKAMKDIVQKSVEMKMDLIDGVTEKLKRTTGIIGAIKKPFIVIGNFKDFITEKIKKISRSIYEVVKKPFIVIGNFKDRVTDKIKGIYSVVKKPFVIVGNFVDKVTTKVGKILSTIASASLVPFLIIGDIKDYITGKVKSIGSAIMNIVKKPFLIIGNINDKITSKIKSISSAIINVVKKPFVVIGNINDKITSKVKGISSSISSVVKKSFTVIGKFKDTVTGGLKKVKSAMSPLMKPFTVIGKFKDNITSKLKGLASSLGPVGSLIGLGVGAGISTAIVSAISGAIKGGAELEQQQISMKHFIGVNNTGLGEAEVDKSTNDFIAKLRNNANTTPFETGEVLSAGARAVNIANGNTKEAMNLVELSENMASLNPGKSISDAMEALADLNVGETERMKEFGFKISAEDVENAGGAGNVDFAKLKNAGGISLTGMFEGGATKLADSGAGLMSTLTGAIKSKASDLGLVLIDMFKPMLSGAITMFDKVSPIIDNMIQGIQPAMQRLGEIVKPIWEGLTVVIDNAWKILQPIFDIFVGVIKLLVEAFKILYPTVKSIFDSIWEIISPIVDNIAILLQGLGDFLQSDGFVGAFKSAFTTVGDIIQSAYDIIAPLLEGIGNAISWVVQGASNVVGKVSDFFNGGDSGNYKPKAIGVSRVPYDGYKMMAHEGEKLLTKQEARQYEKGSQGITIAKMADSIIVREEADIDKIANAFVEKIANSRMNFGG